MDNTEGAAGSEKMLTLTEVAQRLGMSMPTLQRYKKGNQARIPAQGEGRTQRYPESALAVFEQIRAENEGKRGRPRKVAASAEAAPAKPAKVAKAKPAKAAAKTAAKSAKPGRKAKAAEPTAAPVAAAAKAPAKATKGKPAKKVAAKPAAKAARPALKAKATKPAKAAAKAPVKVAAKGKAAKSKGPVEAAGLLTLDAIGKATGISGPTLQRYIKRFSDQIPFVGNGRARRYRQEAIDVFKKLRAESKRGPKAGARLAKRAVRAVSQAASGLDAGIHKRFMALEKLTSALEKKIEALQKELAKPLKITRSRA